MISSLRGELSLFMLWNVYSAKFQCLIRYWYNFMGWWKWECKDSKNKKGYFIQLNGLNKRQLCRQIFKELKILTVTTFYIFEVVGYIKKNKIYLWRNLNMYEYNTRRKCDFHVLSRNMSFFKRRVINTGISRKQDN